MQKMLINWEPLVDPSRLRGKLYVKTEHGRVLPTTSGEVITPEVVDIFSLEDNLVAKTVDGINYILQGNNQAYLGRQDLMQQIFFNV
ncbi:hypothetical protein IKG73_01690 [Candidatus Saccharibacteria bacterium]|nr:hypothetical protein [Candidatus Saccharibacteria bacterium]